MAEKGQKLQMNLTIVALVAVVAIVGLVVLALNSVKSSSFGTKSFSTQTLSATEEEIQDLRGLRQFLLAELEGEEEGNLAGEGVRRKTTVGQSRGRDIESLQEFQEFNKPDPVPSEEIGGGGGYIPCSRMPQLCFSTCNSKAAICKYYSSCPDAGSITPPKGCKGK